MINVLSIVEQDEPETLCGKYYHAGVYPTLETPLWGARSSVSSGIVATETVPLRGDQPYDGLWRLHYATLIGKMERLGLSRFDIDSQEDMRRRIAILCQRNHYPQNSLARIFAWREGRELSGKTHYAIFQQKLARPAFEDDGEKRIIIEGKPEETTVNLDDGPWADTVVEANARRRVAELSRKDCKTYAGMVLRRPDGRVARTTIGNLYLTRGRKVTAVREGGGAAPCALKPFLRTAIEELNSQNDPELAITYEEVDGIEFTMIKDAGGCFVLDNAIGLAPILRLGATFGNELTRNLAAKFRKLF